jgi:hypothetical protein
MRTTRESTVSGSSERHRAGMACAHGNVESRGASPACLVSADGSASRRGMLLPRRQERRIGEGGLALTSDGTVLSGTMVRVKA